MVILLSSLVKYGRMLALKTIPVRAKFQKILD